MTKPKPPWFPRPGDSALPQSIYIGFDPREALAFAICRDSIKKRLSAPIPIHGLVLEDLKARGLYTRATETRVTSDGHKQLWDVISDAPCSTEFSISRFLTPILARDGRKDGEAAGWALFMDSDILVVDNLVRLFEGLDPKHALYCVKHKHAPPPGVKMDGQVQVQYARKNWSSFVVFNVDHPANEALTVEMVNALPGRDLHRFSWIEDDALIGELSPEWNWLVGHNRPKCIHFTEGMPFMAGHENCDFSDDWRRELASWAIG